MPEGHTLHRLARLHQRRFAGSPVQVSSPQGRFADAALVEAGADAVKLQKRDNRAMFTKTALQKPYENEFSYGATYGEHRERPF